MYYQRNGQPGELNPTPLFAAGSKVIILLQFEINNINQQQLPEKFNIPDTKCQGLFLTARLRCNIRHLSSISGQTWFTP